MRFFSPKILWLLPVALFLFILWKIFEKQAQARLARFASPALLEKLTGGIDYGRRRVRMIFAVLSVVFGVLALARPQLGMREEFLPSQGLDLVFLLDVSNSMLAEDMIPNRLKKAKHELRNFLDRLSGDRVGIVAFAGSAYPAVPMTTDYEFIRQTLEIVDESSIPNQGSDLGRALKVAVELLERGGVNEQADESHDAESAQNVGSRVVIVLSDGESHEGEETTLVTALKEKGIQVYSIGFGSLKGGPIPMRDAGGYLQGYKKDLSGSMVLTKLESANLEGVASKTGGAYYAASSNEGEVEEILSRLSTMDRSAGAGRRVVVYDEMYQYPLGAALLFLFFSIFMRDMRRRKQDATTIAALILLAFLTLQPRLHAAETARSLDEYRQARKGADAYSDKDYAGATQAFGKAQADNPDAMRNHMNLGDALLKAGSPDGAIPEFQEVTKSKDPVEAAKGSFNLGKAYETKKDNEQAIRSYQDGLMRLQQAEKPDPEVEGRLKRALERAQTQKEKQQQQSQSGKGDSQDQQGKENKEQQQDQDKDKGEQDQKDKEGQKQQQQAAPNQQGMRRKQQFKGEKLQETDAKRILQQLQEQEKKTQQRVMRGKTGKVKGDKTGKDW